MKIQNLAVIFIIIIVPIALVLEVYTQNRINTINLQTKYDSKLNDATYDAIKAYQLNSFNATDTSELANAKIRNIEASANTFFNSISSGFSELGYTKSTLQNYIPALVYTMYDGYYIYAPFTNTWDTDSKTDEIKNTMINQIGKQFTFEEGEKIYGLKPYVYYSCRYKRNGKFDVTITYSLDNYIQIQGTVQENNGTTKTVSKYGYLLDSIYKGSDVVEAANLVSRHLQEPVFIYCEDFELPHIGPRYLFSHRYGSCVDAADIVTYAFRAVGIPCMEDTDARGGHVWNVVRDTTGRDVPIWYIASEAVRGSRDTGGYKRGKVYRSMYGFQEEKAAHLGDDWKSMPLLFYHPYMKDVSYAYYPDTLRILTGIPDDEVCYLAHFHEAHWWSCACARSASGKMEIPNLESELVYLPMKYTKGNYYPSGFPFWFAGGEINTFLPDWEKTVKVRLYRKYPVYGWLRSFMGHVVGGTFEGSMTKNFEDGKTLYEIADTPVIARNRIFLNKSVKCRYIRYKADNDKCAELAEMTFYANGKAVSPIAVWGSPTEKGNMHVLAKHVADGDPLSYYLSLDKGGEVVVDLGRVAVIDCLEYMPRNDDNFISPGDTYELFCHAGTEGWKSLGKQRADTTCLDWIVPDNALLWLRDLTRGREEHIFFMQNGRQKFPTF